MIRVPSTPKRILFVTWGANLGGVQSSLLTRIRALRDFGITSEVVFCHSGNGKPSFAGVTHYVTKKQSTVAKLVSRGKYDAISFINVTPFLPALRRARYRGKLLYELRGYSEHCLKVCAGLSPEAFGAIVVPSHYVGNLIADVRPAHQIPVHVVYNAVDNQRFQPAQGSVLSEYGRDFGEDGSRPILLWIGRLDWNKNFTELVEIVSNLHRRGLNFATWVITDSKVSSGLVRFQQEVAAAQLEDRIRLFANVPRDQMPKVYQMAAESGGCLLSTSRSEGLQNTVLEGLACGCPVVTSGVGGNLELITDGVNGATYPPGEVERAADEILRLFQDTDRRRRFIERGLERVATRHLPGQHAEGFLKVLAEAPPVIRLPSVSKRKRKKR